MSAIYLDHSEPARNIPAVILDWERAQSNATALVRRLTDRGLEPAGVLSRRAERLLDDPQLADAAFAAFAADADMLADAIDGRR